MKKAPRGRAKHPRASPTRVELNAARSKRVPDIIAEGLRVLFVGINPGLYSAAVGHHFARPGNRFWPVLARSGFTRGVVSPFDERVLLARSLGITNIVSRTTATADELSREELVQGAKRLEKKVRRYAPAFVAVLGVTAYRAAFERPLAALGPQKETLAGARLWVLPNPSGLNAHHQLSDLSRLFRHLRVAAGVLSSSTTRTRDTRSSRTPRRT